VSDPNWLLSTTAQSGAALVAIVGGFLVSRLVTLRSDRITRTRELHFVDEELAAVDARYPVKSKDYINHQETVERNAAERAQLEGRRRVLTADLAGLQRPDDIRSAFIVLTYFAGAGVAFPIVAMAAGWEDNSVVRWLVVTGFLSGLTALGAYLVNASSAPAEFAVATDADD
jgi:hypothetical protein